MDYLHASTIKEIDSGVLQADYYLLQNLSNIKFYIIITICFLTHVSVLQFLVLYIHMQIGNDCVTSGSC